MLLLNKMHHFRRGGNVHDTLSERLQGQWLKKKKKKYVCVCEGESETGKVRVRIKD